MTAEDEGRTSVPFSSFSLLISSSSLSRLFLVSSSSPVTVAFVRFEVCDVGDGAMRSPHHGSCATTNRNRRTTTTTMVSRFAQHGLLGRARIRRARSSHRRAGQSTPYHAIAGHSMPYHISVRQITSQHVTDRVRSRQSTVSEQSTQSEPGAGRCEARGAACAALLSTPC